MSELDWTQLPVRVSARDLAERLSTSPGRQVGEGELILADVRWNLTDGPRRDPYLDGHIPGAIFVDLDRDLTGDDAPDAGRHPFPIDDDFGDTLGGLGIRFEDTVIAYAQNDPMAAARFVVMLRFSGVNAAVLDGGLDAWLREDGALATGNDAREAVDFGTQPFVRLVGIDEVSHAGPTRGAVLIDARSAERFEGRNESIDPRAGHIPGAQNVPYLEVLNSDYTFRTVEEIRDIFEQRGVTKPRITFNYCGSGVSAAVNLLAMDLAGFEHVYLYPGSFSEWSRDDARLVDTGPANS